MTDHDALVRAICAHPDDDTPRLIYADFLEETGEPDRAAFVRAQVELARTPAWEPFAVLCRHRKREWSEEGAPFRHTLPALPPGCGATWHHQPFRRGLGWRVNVTSPRAWAEVAPWLCEQAPVGELHLNTSASTLDELRAFAAGEWVRNLRVVHLDGASPVEPIRVLCDSPHATGITDIHFHRASGAGMPELVEDLLRTPLGRGLKGLHFRVGYESVEYLMEALTPGGELPRLERVTFSTMGLTVDLLQLWFERGGLGSVTDLDLRDNDSIGRYDVEELVEGLNRYGTRLQRLGLASTGLGEGAVRALSYCDGLRGVRELNLSRNYFGTDCVQTVARGEAFSGVRSLNLSECRLDNLAVSHLTRGRLWPGLVRLELRGNPITDGGVHHFLEVPVPPDLTAIHLDGSGWGVSGRAVLREHFGERVVFQEE